MNNIIDKIKDSSLVYRIYVKNDIKSQMEYKMDFCIQIIIWFIYSFIPFLGLSIVFNRFKCIGEWDIYKIGIMYGIVGASYDISRMIGRSLDNFHKLIITGDLDVFFIRPFSILSQVFGNSFFLRRIAGIIQYCAVFIYCFAHIKKDLIMSAPNFLFICLISCITTLLIFLGLLLIYASICFFTIKRNIFSDVVISSTSEIGYFPLDYGLGFIKFIFFTIIPIGFTVYLPTKEAIFLNYASGFNYIYILIASTISIIFFIVCRGIFMYSLRFYNSVNN